VGGRINNAKIFGEKYGMCGSAKGNYILNSSKKFLK
jgi:hypothetical protein